MADRAQVVSSLDWTRAETRLRQIRAGLHMTPAERLDWLEETLDELLPLVGRARAVNRARNNKRG